MPKLLAEADIDPAEDVLNASMTADEERAEMARFSKRNGGEQDLSDGGKVGAATLTPMQDGRPTAKGRANARRAWSWNGTETLLPLAWDTDGKTHDGGRRYLLKQHCLCCGYSGFRGFKCPPCVKNNCDQCGGSTSTAQRKLENGKVINGNIIPANYLRKDAVPFQARFFGDIPCMIEFCPRRGAKGFKTEEDMRMHATMRHRVEYRIRQETQAAHASSETQDLRRKVDELMQQVAGSSTRIGRPPKETPK